MKCDSYVQVRGLDEAIETLSRYDGRARVIAGGTDLVLAERGDEEGPQVLVDIADLPELRFIREENGAIVVGAATTHAELAASPLIRERATALAQAAAAVGSPQIRNVGTVGGNIVNGLPAADTAVALMALDARVDITGPAGTRAAALGDLYLGVGVCALDPAREVLTAIRLEPPTSSDFQRLSQRKALALPVLNAAVGLWLDGSGTCCKARVCAAPVGPVPWRALEAEGALEGHPLSEETILAAGRAAIDVAVCRDSIRGCSEYREAMVEVLVTRALREATARIEARGQGRIG